MIIDAHCHLQKRASFLDDMVEAYMACGVDWAVVCNGGTRFEQPGNEDVLAAHASHPDFVIPFAFIVPGEDHPEAVDAFHAQGFRGLKLQNPRVDYDAPVAYPIYERAAALGMPILFHTGIGARFPRDGEFDVRCDRMRPHRLDTIARAFPNLRLIGAHLGMPYVWEASFAAYYNPNLWFDLAGIDRSGQLMPGLLNYPELFWAGDRHHRQIVFGTEGAPENIAVVKREYEDLLERLNVLPATRRLIMGGTVAAMLGLE
jgi:predicted TIM-barrel fold metal-dependent hydrolase